MLYDPPDDWGAIVRLTLAIAAMAVAVAGCSSSPLDSDEPVTYDTCSEADSEAARWQRESIAAELAAEWIKREAALHMQDRIIVGNPACFPPDVLITALDALGLSADEIPAGPTVRIMITRC